MTACNVKRCHRISAVWGSLVSFSSCFGFKACGALMFWFTLTAPDLVFVSQMTAVKGERRLRYIDCTLRFERIKMISQKRNARSPYSENCALKHAFRTCVWSWCYEMLLRPARADQSELTGLFRAGTLKRQEWQHSIQTERCCSNGQYGEHNVFICTSKLVNFLVDTLNKSMDMKISMVRL